MSLPETENTRSHFTSSPPQQDQQQQKQMSSSNNRTNNNTDNRKPSARPSNFEDPSAGESSNLRNSSMSSTPPMYTSISPTTNMPSNDAPFVNIPQTSNIHDRESLITRVNQVAGRDVSMSSILVHTKFTEKDPRKLREALVKEFNRYVTPETSCIQNASARAGVRVDPGFFFVGSKNRVCEMRAGTGERLALEITAGYTSVEYCHDDKGHGEGVVSQIQPIIGKHSTHLVNVPQGKFGKIFLGQVPLLLDEGSFIFHDPLFRAVESSFLCNQDETHISHGVLNILRVPPATYAKVIINSEPLLLPFRREPYVFSTSLFKFLGNVPESSNYIEHSPLHMLRVRAGKVGLVWQGSKAILLEYRENPYWFEDPTFSVDKANMFQDANSKHIRHGQLIRLRPGVNGELERAVVQCDSEIRFIDRFTVIDSIHDNLVGFIDLSLRTFVFPSQEMRNERRRNDTGASADEVNFESMQTRDSLKIGVKLLVAVQIEDPALTLSRLKLTDIERHIENLAVSDMCRVVQHSSSQNFVNAMQSDVKGSNPNDISGDSTISDRVKNDLEQHLKDCGIILKRFSIEEIKILDAAIQKEMAKQSLVAATANAEQAVLAQKAAIARSQAEVEAMSKRVRQEQENEIKVQNAQADLDAARLRAQGMVVEAEAKAKSSQLEAEMLQKFPELLQLRLAQLQFSSIQKANLTIVSPDLAGSPYALGAQGLLPAVPMRVGPSNNEHQQQQQQQGSSSSSNLLNNNAASSGRK